VNDSISFGYLFGLAAEQPAPEHSPARASLKTCDTKDHLAMSAIRHLINPFLWPLGSRWGEYPKGDCLKI